MKMSSAKDSDVNVYDNGISGTLDCLKSADKLSESTVNSDVDGKCAEFTPLEPFFPIDTPTVPTTEDEKLENWKAAGRAVRQMLSQVSTPQIDSPDLDEDPLQRKLINSLSQDNLQGYTLSESTRNHSNSSKLQSAITSTVFPGMGPNNSTSDAMNEMLDEFQKCNENTCTEINKKENEFLQLADPSDNHVVAGCDKTNLTLHNSEFESTSSVLGCRNDNNNISLCCGKVSSPTELHPGHSCNNMPEGRIAFNRMSPVSLPLYKRLCGNNVIQEDVENNDKESYSGEDSLERSHSLLEASFNDEMMDPVVSNSKCNNCNDTTFVHHPKYNNNAQHIYGLQLDGSRATDSNVSKCSDCVFFNIGANNENSKFVQCSKCYLMSADVVGGSDGVVESGNVCGKTSVENNSIINNDRLSDKCLRSTLCSNDTNTLYYKRDPPFGHVDASSSNSSISSQKKMDGNVSVKDCKTGENDECNLTANREMQWQELKNKIAHLTGKFPPQGGIVSGEDRVSGHTDGSHTKKPLPQKQFIDSGDTADGKINISSVKPVLSDCVHEKLVSTNIGSEEEVTNKVCNRVITHEVNNKMHHKNLIRPCKKYQNHQTVDTRQMDSYLPLTVDINRPSSLNTRTKEKPFKDVQIKKIHTSSGEKQNLLTSESSNNNIRKKIKTQSVAEEVVLDGEAIGMKEQMHSHEKEISTCECKLDQKVKIKSDGRVLTGDIASNSCPLTQEGNNYDNPLPMTLQHWGNSKNLIKDSAKTLMQLNSNKIEELKSTLCIGESEIQYLVCNSANNILKSTDEISSNNALKSAEETSMSKGLEDLYINMCEERGKCESMSSNVGGKSAVVNDLQAKTDKLFESNRHRLNKLHVGKLNCDSSENFFLESNGYRDTNLENSHDSAALKSMKMNQIINCTPESSDKAMNKLQSKPVMETKSSQYPSVYTREKLKDSIVSESGKTDNYCDYLNCDKSGSDISDTGNDESSDEDDDKSSDEDDDNDAWCSCDLCTSHSIPPPAATTYNMISRNSNDNTTRDSKKAIQESNNNKTMRETKLNGCDSEGESSSLGSDSECPGLVTDDSNDGDEESEAQQMSSCEQEIVYWETHSGYDGDSMPELITTTDDDDDVEDDVPLGSAFKHDPQSPSNSSLTKTSPERHESGDSDFGEDITGLTNLNLSSNVPSEEEEDVVITPRDMESLPELRFSETDSENGSEADDEFECECEVCVSSRQDQQDEEPDYDDPWSSIQILPEVMDALNGPAYHTSPHSVGDGFYLDFHNNSTSADESDTWPLPFAISLSDLSPLELLLTRQSRRDLLELMFQNVFAQMLAVYPELLGERAPPPLSSEDVALLPLVKVQHDKEASCPICLCEFEENEEARQLPCKHIFHTLCIEAWFAKSGTCPVCRDVVKL